MNLNNFGPGNGWLWNNQSGKSMQSFLCVLKCNQFFLSSRLILLPRLVAPLKCFITITSFSLLILLAYTSLLFHYLCPMLRCHFLPDRLPASRSVASGSINLRTGEYGVCVCARDNQPSQKSPHLSSLCFALQTATSSTNMTADVKDRR